MRIFRILAIACSLILCAASIGSCLTWVPPINYDPGEPCKGPTIGGTSMLSISEWFSAAGEEPMWEQKDLIAFGLGGGFGSYSFTWGDQDLAGTITCAWYKAYDRERGVQCRHGAEIDLRYNGPDQGDVDWVQVVVNNPTGYGDTGAPDPPAGGWVDLNGNDTQDEGETADDNPGYFNDGWNREDFMHVKGQSGTKFGDTPLRAHNDWHSIHGTVQYYAVLAKGLKSANKRVVLYDVVQWGFQYDCIPEPSSLAALMIGLALTAGAALRRRRV